MSTGNLAGNLDRLERALRRMGYTRDLDRVGAEEGDPVALLPPLHFIFLGYSKLFAAKIAERGFELMGKTDVRFVEGLWKVMRDVFRYRPSITASQFLLKGYAERKAILVYDLAELCRKWHERLARDARLEGLRTTPGAPVLFERERAKQQRQQQQAQQMQSRPASARAESRKTPAKAPAKCSRTATPDRSTAAAAAEAGVRQSPEMHVEAQPPRVKHIEEIRGDDLAETGRVVVQRHHMPSAAPGRTVRDDGEREREAAPAPPQGLASAPACDPGTTPRAERLFEMPETAPYTIGVRRQAPRRGPRGAEDRMDPAADDDSCDGSEGSEGLREHVAMLTQRLSAVETVYSRALQAAMARIAVLEGRVRFLEAGCAHDSPGGVDAAAEAPTPVMRAVEERKGGERDGIGRLRADQPVLQDVADRNALTAAGRADVADAMPPLPPGASDFEVAVHKRWTEVARVLQSTA